MSDPVTDPGAEFGAQLWESVVEALTASNSLTPSYLAMARTCHAVDVEGTLVVVVNSKFVKQRLTDRAVSATIKTAVADQIGYDMPIIYTVAPGAKDLEVIISAARAAVHGNSAASGVPGSATPGVNADAAASSPAASAAPNSPAAPTASTQAPSSQFKGNIPTPAELNLGHGANDAAAPSAPQQLGLELGQENGLVVPDTQTVVEFGRPEQPKKAARGKGLNVRPSDVLDDSKLNPRYTFDTYVVGSSNRFAYAASYAVAETPAKTYNPLFIYGGSGLGKTHLLHGIGHYTRAYHKSKVKYVNSEEFVSDFITSVSEGRMDAFKRRYRQVDILLVDDIQFLQDKEQTLEEFFHTFNALYNANKQVVLTSDQPTKALKIDERLRSRFDMGLSTDVQPPDLETRIAILSRRAQADKLDVPPQVLDYIASRISANIRELEGALIRVTAYASINKLKVDLPVAEMVLKDLVSNQDTGNITAALIIGQTADYFGITIEDLSSANRSRTIVTARHIAMYLCRELTDLSLPKIGREFGGRDHTTVMSADKKVRTQMSAQADTYKQVTELTSRIKQAAATPHS